MALFQSTERALAGGTNPVLRTRISIAEDGLETADYARDMVWRLLLYGQLSVGGIEPFQMRKEDAYCGSQPGR